MEPGRPTATRSRPSRATEEPGAAGRARLAAVQPSHLRLDGPAASIDAAAEPPSEVRVPSLYIDGEWVASANGECSPVVNPSDASVVTEVDVATDEQVQAAIGAARRAFDETDWPRSADRRTRGAARSRRRPDRSRPGGAGPARDRSTPARRCARAVGTCRMSRVSSATTPILPTRTRGGWSTPAIPTPSAASSTSRSACAG